MIELTTLGTLAEETTPEGVAIKFIGWVEKHITEGWFKSREDRAAHVLQKFYHTKLKGNALHRRIRRVDFPFRGLLRTPHGEISDAFHFGRPHQRQFHQFVQHREYLRPCNCGYHNLYRKISRPVRFLHGPFLPELSLGRLPDTLEEAASRLTTHPSATDLRSYNHFIVQMSRRFEIDQGTAPHFRVFTRTTRVEGDAPFQGSISRELSSFEKQQKLNYRLHRFLEKVKRLNADDPLRLVKTDEEVKLAEEKSLIKRRGGGGGGGGLRINTDVIPRGGGGGGLRINTDVIPRGGAGGGLERQIKPFSEQDAIERQRTLHSVLQLLEGITDPNVLDELIDFIFESF
jgi:hypothetical protein